MGFLHETAPTTRPTSLSCVYSRCMAVCSQGACWLLMIMADRPFLSDDHHFSLNIAVRRLDLACYNN